MRRFLLAAVLCLVASGARAQINIGPPPVAAGLIPLADLAHQAANTVAGNATGSSASPTALAAPSCSTAASALIWTTNSGFGCNTSITANAVPAGNLTGATLAAGVLASSLTSLGTITALVVNGTAAITGSTVSNPIITVSATTGAAALPTSISGTMLQMGNADAQSPRISLESWGTNGALIGRRANGTIALPTTLVSGSIALQVAGAGYDGTAYSTGSAGSLNILATQTWAVGQHGTEVGIATTPNNSITAAFTAKFGQDGSFTVGSTSGTGTGALFAGATTLTSTLNLTGIAAASGADILCYNNTGGPVTYATTVVGCVPSAERFKNVKGRVDPRMALAGVMNLTPALYSYKPEMNLGTNDQAGLLADQVCEIDPLLCHRDDNGAIDNYDKIGMFATLVAAFQEYVRTHP